MSTLEELEMQAHRATLADDVAALLEKYRAIFDWDVPEIDEAAADRLIFQSLRQALDELQVQAARPATP
jgi:hypothetical protein